MIGRRMLPTSFQKWNAKWGAPFGFGELADIPIPARLIAPDLRRFGPFAFQGNNSTRIVEFPWAYFAGQTSAGMRVLEGGAGLSGLQFVLSLEGCRVINVDPGHEPWHAWDGSPETHQRLNKGFGTDVELVRTRVEEFDAPESSFDRIFCISVVEHMEDENAKAAMANFGRLLKPGGICVLTVDLCLDIEPFTDVQRNSIGVNKDIAQLVGASDLELVAGYRDELLGFPEFDPAVVGGQVPDLLVGEFFIPVVAQMCVLRKRWPGRRRDAGMPH
jgi:2-polyprenyl-3-methyl-5-hydroxy-6-metoxy-1,4-benzoquinol methylase